VLPFETLLPVLGELRTCSFKPSFISFLKKSIYYQGINKDANPKPHCEKKKTPQTQINR
jgi:hypothetical protein